MPKTRKMIRMKMEKVIEEIKSAMSVISTQVSVVEGSMSSIGKTLVLILVKLEGRSPLEETVGTPPGGAQMRDSCGDSNCNTENSGDGSGIPHMISNLPRMDQPLFDGNDPLTWCSNRTIFSGAPHFPSGCFAAQQQYPGINSHRRLLSDLEAMHLTRKTGSLEDYISLFEERVAQLPPLPLEHYLGAFLGGLQSAIRGTNSKCRDSRSALAPLLWIVDSKGFRKSRHLAPEQVDDYRAKGKYFKCSQPYNPLHKCASKYLSVTIDAEGEDEGEVVDGQEKLDIVQVERIETELQQLQLSRLSSNGIDGTQTLKLFTKVNGRRLLMMVDSGASHYFISEHMAHSLQLSVDNTSHFTMVLEDGSRVHTRGTCKDIPVIINGHKFVITCYVFSLRSVDIILGVTWLAQLGDVIAN
ncbi:hypothetical protein C2S51_016347 [Perilla frutescens var. frutescens]|nr:hypothetical protein C2S51_016347 [Perilla frutescens var. frutescens]